MKKCFLVILIFMMVIMAFTALIDPQVVVFSLLKAMGATESCNPPVDTTSRQLAGKKLAELKLKSNGYIYGGPSDTENFMRETGILSYLLSAAKLHRVTFDGTFYHALFIVGPDYCPPPPGAPAHEEAKAPTDKPPKPNVTLYKPIPLVVSFLALCALAFNFWPKNQYAEKVRV